MGYGLSYWCYGLVVVGIYIHYRRDPPPFLLQKFSIRDHRSLDTTNRHLIFNVSQQQESVWDVGHNHI